MRSLNGWILMAVVAAVSPLVVGLSWTAMEEAKADAPTSKVAVVALDFGKKGFDARLTVEHGSLLAIHKAGTGLVALVAPNKRKTTLLTVWEPTFAPDGMQVRYTKLTQMPRYWFAKGQRMEFEANVVAWADRDQVTESYRQRLTR